MKEYLTFLSPKGIKPWQKGIKLSQKGIKLSPKGIKLWKSLRISYKIATDFPRNRYGFSIKSLRISNV